MFDRSRTLARSEAPLDEQGGLGHRLAPLYGRAIVELRRVRVRVRVRVSVTVRVRVGVRVLNLRGVHAGLVDRLAVDRVDQRLHQRLEGDHLDLVRARVRLGLSVRVMVTVRVRAISTVEVTPLS